MQPLILPYDGIAPTIHETAFVAPGAVVIGDVHIGAGSSIWYGCVLRGDVCHIRVGENTNLQDGTVVHVTRNTGPTIIGSGITVGHQAIIHACELQDNSFIGMGALLLDGAVVESGAMLAAGAMLAPGKRVPAGQLWAGNPAKYFRDLRQSELDWFPGSAEHYRVLGEKHRELTSA